MRAGEVLAGRFELLRTIGRGGNGEVWRCRDTVLEREVAVKLLDLGDADERVRRRFHQEARSAAALIHPHVVAVHDAGIDGSRAFLVMELLPGPTLAALVRREGPLPPARAVDLAAQAAAGLEAVHRVGIVHRDVKPGNLVLDSLGRVKVVDFGIASVREATATQLTAPGTLVGSASYLSPEQARGESATPASDHYGLGCTLMTLLTGEPPFSAEHPLAVLQQHLSELPPRVVSRRPEVPAWIDALVDDLLAKEPGRRAAGFAVLLDRGGVLPPPPPVDSTSSMPPPTRTLVATSSGWGTGSGTGSGPSPLPPPPPPRHSRTAGPPAWAVPAVLGLLVLMVAVVLVAALAGGDDDQRAAAGAADTDTPSTTLAAEPPNSTTSAPVPRRQQSVDTPVGPADAMSSLRAVVDLAARAGELDDKAIGALDKRMDRLDRAIAGGESGDRMTKALDDLDKALADSIGKNQVRPATAQRLRAAAQAVRDAASTAG
ncbi:serine/threonine-protein kinase [Nocardioides caeni]|uniref:non-specific serine/threonine protein kinase n=1 Tax=Nocardioides caeni TaxID=574700 RepID=A0A4S8NN15_9ACTN|nr:serine/threonine-protein kinase [Nocardioides caeni]THV18337.1 serine/threonine protein kinase [Nocardioides caeni]